MSLFIMLSLKGVYTLEAKKHWHRSEMLARPSPKTCTGCSGICVTENRRIEINYPGSGNYSQFLYDGYGHMVQIVETVSSTVSSTKQFVWCDERMSEARNSSGVLTAQYFNYGLGNSGTSYFYSLDQLGSIRELADSSGALEAQYLYDPYGRVTKSVGNSSADFQYSGYYFHAPSGLSLTINRAYNAALGRWINRDPIEEAGGENLYSYVDGNPESQSDPYGLFPLLPSPIGPIWPGSIPPFPIPYGPYPQYGPFPPTPGSGHHRQHRRHGRPTNCPARKPPLPPPLSPPQPPPPPSLPPLPPPSQPPPQPPSPPTGGMVKPFPGTPFPWPFDGFDPDIPRQIIEKLFQLGPGGQNPLNPQ